MATDAGIDWHLDSPWRRLHWTLTGAVIIGLLSLWTGALFMPGPAQRPVEIPPLDAQFIELPPPPPAREIVLKTAHKPPPSVDEPEPKDAPEPPPTPEKQLASMAAPPAPSTEEWQLASTYKLKNSKRYRHNWGQLVRSMMGTAVEGPEQGQVRFRIEIAPDGKVAKVEELWSTSENASKLAWQAIRNLPSTPPTPTGKPLVFEQTISFLPHETGWPPSYKNDCLPDPPVFRNPFAWNGSSPQRDSQEHPESASPTRNDLPQADCPTDSTSDSIEEEERELKRQMDQWRWGR
jgi:hypothetical protein